MYCSHAELHMVLVNTSGAVFSMCTSVYLDSVALAVSIVTYGHCFCGQWGLQGMLCAVTLMLVSLLRADALMLQLRGLLLRLLSALTFLTSSERPHVPGVSWAPSRPWRLLSALTSLASPERPHVPGVSWAPSLPWRLLNTLTSLTSSERPHVPGVSFPTVTTGAV
jgi:hypothetical protein